MMFLAAFIMFTLVSISVCPDLLRCESVCVPLPVCKCVFLCQCASSSVTYLSVICNSRVRSVLRGQIWADIGFTDMCEEVRGYRDEMTLIGQSESVVCPERRLGCNV